MAKGPIKERIVVVQYEALREDVYRQVCGALGGFLRTRMTETFHEERLNIPGIALPLPTVGDIEPNWKDLKVLIDRPSRFWNESKTKCVQFFKDSLTVNLISSNEDVEFTHLDLLAFFEKIQPFLDFHRAEFHISSIGIDYQNVLAGSELRSYTADEGRSLQLDKILQERFLGQKIEGTAFVAPILHKFAYESKPRSLDGRPINLSVEISIPHSPTVGRWCVVVMLSTRAKFTMATDKHLLKECLLQLHSMVSKGYYAVFTDNITGGNIDKERM